MSDRRFAISIHILTLLTKNQNKWLSSDYIAGSININPVLVRKELSSLRNHGFVISKEGKNGGCMLNKMAENIYLSDIYRTVSSQTILGNALAAPNQKCSVGSQINAHFLDLSIEAENILIEKLSNQTLADFSKKFE